MHSGYCPPEGANIGSSVSIFRNTFSLAADRTSGELIPNLAGDFLRVESADLPCFISFGTQGRDQAIPMVAGMVIETPFSGVTIYHDNYIGWGAGISFPKLVLNVGAGCKVFVDAQQAGTGLGVPVSLVVSTTANQEHWMPMFPGYKKVTARVIAAGQLGVVPSGILIVGEFRNVAGTFLAGGGLNRNGIVYGTLSRTLYQPVAPILVGAGNYSWAHQFTDIPIPTGAEYLRFSWAYDPVLTTANGVSGVQGWFS